MPFTFCHPAIILPLSRLSPRWFSLTGLVVGSLTPDFEYFLRMRMAGAYSHTLQGMVVFCLPVGILLPFFFHNVVRNSLFKNLPSFLRSRLIQFTTFDWNQYFWKRWFTVALSVLVGAASHLFWDGFTHAHGYFVTKFPLLASNMHLGALEIELFRALQHLSTLVGGIVIVAAILSLPKRETGNPIVGSRKYWTVFTVVAVMIIAVALVSAARMPGTTSVIVIVISAGLLSLVFTPLIVKGE
jgi:hypothetical protein